MKTKQPRLLTIAFSHYCEKARWALERAGVDFREEAHPPPLHVLPNLRARARRTVPALVIPGTRTLADSTDILRYADAQAPADRRLFPDDPQARRDVEALEDRFDERLGPHTRRLMYSHLLENRDLVVRLFRTRAPGWEGEAAARLFPVTRQLMIRSMRIDAEGARRSRAAIDEVFGEVAQRLSDGRRWLVGDRFGAADLTFAALAAPVLVPAGYGVPLPSIDEVPPAAAALVREMRETPAGRFALRVYATERHL
jgi:glutathione S-transferase